LKYIYTYTNTYMKVKNMGVKMTTGEYVRTHTHTHTTDIFASRNPRLEVQPRDRQALTYKRLTD